MFNELQWVTGEQGTPYRLPPKGPVSSIHSPILLLITQSHYVHAWFVPPYFPGVQIAKAPLQEVMQSHFASVVDFADISPESRGGRRLCTHATIGLIHNGIRSVPMTHALAHENNLPESTVMVATRSKPFPPTESSQLAFTGMDLGIPLDLSNTPESAAASVSDQWEDESSIFITAVFLSYRAPVSGT